MEVVVGLLIFMAGHLGAAIWFASKINTQIKSVVETVKILSSKIEVTVTQDIKLAVLDQRLMATEQRLRDIRDLIVGREARDLAAIKREHSE